jgi:hypothetical protein
LSVPFDALPNFSRNFYDRADDHRQAAPRRLYVRTVERVRNRRQSESLKFSLSHFSLFLGVAFVAFSFLFLVRTFANFALSQLASRHRLIKTGRLGCDFRYRTTLDFPKIARRVIVKAEKFPVERHKFGGWIHSR